MNLGVIDVIFLLLIAVFMVRCFLKGFVSEVLTMAAFVLGIFVAVFFYKYGANYLMENYWEDKLILSSIAAFIALFLIAFIIVKLLEVVLKGILNKIKMGGVDKLLGLIFGLLEGLALVSLVLFVMQLLPFTSDILAGSIFADILLPLIKGNNFFTPAVTPVVEPVSLYFINWILPNV